MKPMRVVDDPIYNKISRLEWADGSISVDWYNLTRANDILRNYDRYVDNMVKGDRLKAYRFAARKTTAGEFSEHGASQVA